ncbi:Aquaporin-1 [Golovinomyces cichoracearum]|uniref:Aquaporin-1 n=1 Tax=Golovinomyces cichoracearum TaxID=62708 RepID=A0A420I410_9PEZI|nr:Aquaporin-1 [Golovinomyces cichoracearum]
MSGAVGPADDAMGDNQLSPRSSSARPDENDAPRPESPPPDAPIISQIKASKSQNNVDGRPSGLRRKPSDPYRRSFQSEFDRPELHDYSSRRRLRASTDASQENDYYNFHPDTRERTRPPRAHRNVDGFWERQPTSATKPHFDENVLDLERGPDRSHHNYDRGSSPDSLFDQKQHYDHKNMSRREKAEMGLTWVHLMNSSLKNHIVAFLGEFVGTTMFLFFAFAGAQVANIGVNAEAQSSDFDGTPTFDIAVYLYISFIFGFSLLVNVWVFYRISGALFNPAVTLGMVLVGAIPIVRAIFLFVAQILGGIAASAMVLGMFPVPLSVRTSLGPGTSLVQGVFIEAVLTAELVFTIFMLAKEKHRATFLAPIGIGFALFIAHLVGVYFTGSSLNPARSFGPCVITATFEDEHWIYWVGPFLGALIAVVFYKVLVLLEYEMANPGQDGDDRNDPTKNEARYREIVQRRNNKWFS